jgi:hypothetical protein
MGKHFPPVTEVQEEFGTKTSSKIARYLLSSIGIR